MEEVWNDINLSSLHHYNDTAISNHSRQTFPFQDFFSSKVDPIATTPPPSQAATKNDSSFPGDRAIIPTKRVSSSITSTTLSLNNALESDDDHFEFGFGFPKKTTTNHDVTTDRTLDISLARHHHNNHKRAKDNSDTIETNEQRNKRLMKSRESADRSRAKKQAYTNWLEQEVAVLRKENARLRNQIAQFYLAVPVEVPKKPSLSRTLTAPF